MATEGLGSKEESKQEKLMTSNPNEDMHHGHPTNEQEIIALSYHLACLNCIKRKESTIILSKQTKYVPIHTTRIRRCPLKIKKKTLQSIQNSRHSLTPPCAPITSHTFLPSPTSVMHPLPLTGPLHCHVLLDSFSSMVTYCKGRKILIKCFFHVIYRMVKACFKAMIHTSFSVGGKIKRKKNQGTR